MPCAANLTNTVSNSTLPSWTTLNVNIGNDFNQSGGALSRFHGLRVLLNITNVGRVPDFFSGTAR